MEGNQRQIFGMKKGGLLALSLYLAFMHLIHCYSRGRLQLLCSLSPKFLLQSAHERTSQMVNQYNQTRFSLRQYFSEPTEQALCPFDFRPLNQAPGGRDFFPRRIGLLPLSIPECSAPELGRASDLCHL